MTCSFFQVQIVYQVGETYKVYFTVTPFVEEPPNAKWQLDPDLTKPPNGTGGAGNPNAKHLPFPMGGL